MHYQKCFYRVLFGVLFTSIHVNESAKILYLSTVATRSHALWNSMLARALAERGHQVTLITTSEVKESVPNVTVFVLDRAYDQASEIDLLSDDFERLSPFANLELGNLWNTITCRRMATGPTFKKFLNKFPEDRKTFDLIIHDSAYCEIFLGLVHRFGYPPHVTITAYGSPQYYSEAAGNFDNPSIVPQYLLSYTQHMTYMQRVYSTLIYFYSSYYYRNIVLGAQNELAKEIFGMSVPDVWDIAINTSITFVNHHFSIDEPKATVPSVISVAGMHIRSSRQLPPDLKEFLDGANDGAVFFSFGSTLKSSWMPESKRKMLLEAFAEMPHRVVFKWDEDLPDLKPNMMTRSWLPQSDILGHPNVRVFISHCGLLGTQEAIYHGVPLLGIPIFVDQHKNAEKMESRGIAIYMHWNNLTKPSLIKAVQDIINNPSYKEKITAISKQFRDQPEAPLQRALYWIEYVLRHEGAAHLKSPAVNMSHFQILLLDIIVPVALIIFTIIYIIYCLIKIIFKMLVNSQHKQKHKVN